MIIENVRVIVIKLIVETLFNTNSYFKALSLIVKIYKKYHISRMLYQISVNIFLFLCYHIRKITKEVSYE